MFERLLGKFPVFASRAKLGNLKDANNTTYYGDSNNFWRINKLPYEMGFDKQPSKEQLNGVLNFVTANLGYLFDRGVPEFTLNHAYPKDAVVTFDGHLYISQTDRNTTHISSVHWKRIDVEVSPARDTTPVGTIVTVPMNTHIDGYIEYVGGDKFDKTMYPDLYQALGSDTFAVSSSNEFDGLPVGSMVHVVGDAPVPAGWVEWDGSYGKLAKYPDLARALRKMAESMPLGKTREHWIQALNTDSLPMFEGHFHLAFGENGAYESDTTKREEFISAPAVITDINKINPLGYKSCVKESASNPVVSTPTSTSEASFASPYVVVAQSANELQQSTHAFRSVLGTGDETKPKTLYTKVIIKAVHPRQSAISTTHKQLIKAF
jgi:hypothetical protein